MQGFIIRLIVAAVGLWLAAAIVPGMVIFGVGTLLLAALLLGIVNAFVRPLVVVLTLPFTIITLGLFLIVVNTAMLGLVAFILPNFALAGFFSALFGSILMSIISWLASWLIGPKGKVDVIVVKRKSK